MTDKHIASLPCWQGTVTIEPLAGGITNRNYIVEDAGRRFVVRVCHPLPHLGICRANEVVCQRLAASLGLAPAVRYYQEGTLVSEYVEGRTLKPENVREPALLKRLAATLRTLHDAWDRLEGELIYFSPLQTVRTYAATARRMGASLPDEVDELIEGAVRLAHTLSPFTPVLCHNDLLAANLLEEGNRLWLVDWEYAGIGNPLFDLANVSSNNDLNAEDDRLLLEAYRGRCVESDVKDLNTLKVISLLRESLWGFIQTKASDLDFDYGKYALDNLHAYGVAVRAALA